MISTNNPVLATQTLEYYDRIGNVHDFMTFKILKFLKFGKKSHA